MTGKSGIATALVALFLVSLAPARAQAPLSMQATGTLTLYVRTEFGERLKIPPQVTLTPVTTSIPMPYVPTFTGDGGIIFNHLVPGEDYEVVIKADQYEVATETVTLPMGSGSSLTTIIYLRSLGEKRPPPQIKGQFMLAPRAEKEVQRGLNDLRSQHYDSARKHLEKALKMAPGNPYVNYIMGMSYVSSQQIVLAKPYLEKSVSINPMQPASLIALGTVRFQSGDYPGAVDVLEQAVKLDDKSWKAEWILSDAYLRQRNFAKSLEYAKQALANGKEDAAPAQILEGEALAGLGEGDKAAETLKSYLQAHPKDPNAAKIQDFAASLRRPVVVPAKAPASPASATAPGQPSTAVSPARRTDSAGSPTAADLAEPPPKDNWAPPDVDMTKPFVIAGAACHLPNILAAAEKNAVQLINELQEFSAIEDYQSVEIKRDDRLREPVSRQFNYMVFINKTRDGLFDVQEMRNTRVGRGEIPGLLADMGAPALALAFYPKLQNDFDWTCEGLGDWKGMPAWVVHFEQRKDRSTSRLAGFMTPSQDLDLIPLKGRAWVAENGGQVLHLDTDLTHPLKDIGLAREHFSIDYGPVSFKTHKVQLWLPQVVDVYYHYRNHYIHNYHRFTDFKLFWVGASQKISTPKQTRPQR